MRKKSKSSKPRCALSQSRLWGMAGSRLLASSRSCSYARYWEPPSRDFVLVTASTAASSFALAALDWANQRDPVLM